MLQSTRILLSLCSHFLHCPLLPISFSRFSPMDARCQMALDEIRQEEWAKLEAATEECIQNSGQQLDSAAAALMKVGFAWRGGSYLGMQIAARSLSLGVHPKAHAC